MLSPGDIIFQEINEESSFSDAISSCGGNDIESFSARINHVGVYTGNGIVIDASSSLGVTKKSIVSFLASGRLNIAATITDSTLIHRAIERLTACLDMPYNPSFYPDSNGFYCSQLVTHAFKYSCGKLYFDLYPMNFIDHKMECISPYWIAYYAKMNKAIPHGLLGSHPQQLLNQQHKFTSVKTILK